MDDTLSRECDMDFHIVPGGAAKEIGVGRRIIQRAKAVRRLIGTGAEGATAVSLVLPSVDVETTRRVRYYGIKWVVRCLLATVSIAGFASSTCAQTVPGRTSVFHHENVLGTTLELRVQADSDETAARAEQRALAEIDRLAKIFSTYDETSEFSRWLTTRGRPQSVSRELFAVLQESEQWRIATQGAFNPAA
jgi:hypothetical protein